MFLRIMNIGIYKLSLKIDPLYSDFLSFNDKRNLKVKTAAVFGHFLEKWLLLFQHTVRLDVFNHLFFWTLWPIFLNEET